MAEERASYLGVAGHGMLLSLGCPCRVAREPGERLWISAGGTLVDVNPSEQPSITVLNHGKVEDAILRIDRGLPDHPWNLVVPLPGFFLDLPMGVVVYSGTDDDPLPELHLRPADMRGAGVLQDVFIQFGVTRKDASEVRVTEKHDIEEFTIKLAVDDGEIAVRAWEYGYELDGVRWRKRHYALSLLPGVTVSMLGQAPEPERQRMFALCDEVAASFGSMHGLDAK